MAITSSGGRALWSRLALVAALLTGLPAAAEHVVDDRPFRALDGPLVSGVRITMEPLSLDDGTAVVLELIRVEPFTEGCRSSCTGRTATRDAPLPPDRWFTGRVSDDPDSFVMLARGRSLRGFIVTRGRVATIGPEKNVYGEGPHGRTLISHVRSRRGHAPEDALVHVRNGLAAGAPGGPRAGSGRPPCPHDRHVLRRDRDRDGLRALHEEGIFGHRGRAVRRRSLRGDLRDLPARHPRDAAGELPFGLDDPATPGSRRPPATRSANSFRTGTRTAPRSRAPSRTCSRAGASAEVSRTSTRCAAASGTP